MSYVYESDDDDIDNSYRQYEIREGIVFLVDVAPSVVAVDGTTSQLYEILAAINDLMAELIITLPKTGVGIYLYNCTVGPKSKAKPIHSVPHAYKLFGLADLNIHNMKLLNDLLQDHRTGVIDINKLVIPDNPNKPSSGFDPAVLPKMLTKLMGELNKKAKYNLKKVVWFTSNDNPLLGDEKHKEAMWRIINDYSQNYYYIDPIFLDKFDPKLGKKLPFDMSVYQDIFINTNYLNNRKRRAQLDIGDDNKKENSNYPPRYKDVMFDGLSANSNKFKKTTITKQIRSSIFRLKEIKRIVFNCNLILSDGANAGNFGCTVKGYSIYTHESIRHTKHLYPHLEHLKLIYLDTSLVKESLGEALELPPKNHKKSQRQREEEISVMKGLELPKGKVIYFNNEQVEFMKSSVFDNSKDSKEPIDIDKETDQDKDSADDVNDDELTNISLSYAPYLKLIGFRDISNFQPYYNSSPPIFVTADLDNGLRSYSSSGGYSNSLKTFSALYQQCLKLQKFAMVFGPYKRNATPCLYALIPSRLTFSIDLKFPEGFLMVRLPWLEDVRSLPNDYIDLGTTFSTSDKDLVKTFKLLIGAFSVESVDPKEFPNPALNYFYLIMKYNLLQMDITECDLTVEDKLKQILENNREKITSDDEIRLLFAEIKKYQLQELSDVPLVPPNAKQSKQQSLKSFSAEGLEPSEIIVLCHKHQDWKQATVPMLKEFSKSKSIAVDGKTKQAFIDAIGNYLDEK